MNAMARRFFKTKFLALLFVLGGGLVACGGPVEEHFATLTVQNETYTNVIITKVSKTDVFFQHARGMGNVQLKNLSPELQKHFTFNPSEAAKVEKAQAAANAELHKQSVRAPRLNPEAYAREPEVQVPEGLEVGKKFPGFEVMDLSGQALSVAGFRGKVVLLDFWATWCGPCRQALPDVQATYQQFHSQSFEVIGISLDEDRKTLDRFIQQAGLPWPQYFDGGGWDNKLAKQYGVRSIPATFLLNQRGVIIAKNLHGDDLARAVARAVTKP